MFKVLGNAWKIPELRKKILYTLLILLIYRVGCYIPIPGVNSAFIAQQVGQLNLLGFMDAFSGGALRNMTLFALGITPYINASIIMNLLCVAIPALERLSKNGDDGSKKIQMITRFLGVGLGLVQAIGIIFGLGSGAVADRHWFNYVTIILCMTAGTALIMWLGERINEKGVGNGISLIIFISIVSSVLPSTISLIGGMFTTGEGGSLVAWWILPVIIVCVLVVLVAITFVDMGERRIPVQYAKKVVGRKMYGGQSTYIPMKLNQSGVMPLIFATTFIQFPGMIGQLFGTDSGFYQFWERYLSSGSVIYMVVYLLLVLFFTYFYSQIAFNPIEVSKNMQQYGGFIPGIRPGKPTSDYLARILSRITLFGALFLAVLAAVPTLMSRMTNSISNMFGFGATSLLILVSVALETSKAIESQMMMRHYKGFLK